MVRIIHDGRRFRLDGHRGEAGFLDVMKWQLEGKRARWPRRVENKASARPPQRVHGHDLAATWIGHSTVLVQTGGRNILTDPFLSERASPVGFAGPRRVRPPALHAADLPPIDIILLSHNHYDHMDLPALRQIAHHHNPQVVTPKGNARWIRRAMPKARIDELLWDESTEAAGFSVHLAPALHWSKRGLFDANSALWGAFAVKTPGGLVYFAGDTGFGSGSTFRHIRERFGAPRLSLLPIGAYEPRWFMHPQHMNPAEAVAAHNLLGSRTSLAIHHGTIQLTDEAIDAPVTALRASLAEHSIDTARFLVTDAGETIGIE
jgi:L-ascorbate metabolism protein UlaG (beta-lactamase superfamily)